MESENSWNDFDWEWSNTEFKTSIFIGNIKKEWKGG